MSVLKHYDWNRVVVLAGEHAKKFIYIKDAFEVCIFVGLSCAVSREGCRILTAVYKMFKTSEPCRKVLRAEILYSASRRQA